MKNLKHSKYKNTAILFEMLVRKLTSETMTSDKTVTVDIIKKYFGKNTTLSKELQLYNSLIKEKIESEAKALDFIRSCKNAHSKLNKSALRRQRYNLVKEISENFDFNKISKIRINNYKELASIYKLFEYNDADNPKELLECKSSIVDHLNGKSEITLKLSPLLEKYKKYDKDVRLLTYKLLVDKFNTKYSNLDENQKNILNKYITHVNDSESIKSHLELIIPKIKKELKEQVSKISDKATKIKVDKLSEMLCNIESIKVIKESHILSVLRYYDLIKELKQVNK
mgnify:FL=1|tara:strand:+ start:539 stop:1390 length:852 start_codon:yes stop_codon:yes gene_type:complete